MVYGMNKYKKEVLQAQLNNEKAVLKKLEEMYKEALLEINDKIAILLGRQDADLQYVIYQVQYQEALKTQIQAILEKLQADEFETLSEYLANAYEEGFLGTMYNLQGQGIPLIFPIDQEQVLAAIQTESNLSTTLYESLGHNIKDLQKKIAGEISRGIAGGQMYTEITRNIAGYARIPKNNAMRITRTEANRIQNKASMDACNKAKSKGADVVKQWDATLDKRTRKRHRHVDGEIRELDEPFSNGLMYPSDPDGKPEEVINCRCDLLQRARWAVGNDFTKWGENAPVMIDDDGTTQFHNIEAKNYDDFKKQYLKASERVRSNAQKMKGQNTLENNGKSSKIKLQVNLFDKDDDLYLDAFSIEELPDYEDVCIHGSPSSVQKKINGKKTDMNASEFAKYLKTTNYKGGNIRLASCETGKGDNSFAQQLSKELGVKVIAPDDDVYYLPDEGIVFVGSPHSNTGKWRVFNNGVEEWEEDI